jgi:hypothetical protein
MSVPADALPANTVAAFTMSAYLLLKLALSERERSERLVRDLSFSRVDKALPSIGALPPASAQTVYSAFHQGIGHLRQRQFPEALRLFQVAGSSFLTLMEEGRHLEGMAVFQIILRDFAEATKDVQISDVLATAVGAAVYSDRGALPDFTHMARVGLAAQTDGAYDEFIHTLVKAVRPAQMREPASAAGILGLTGQALVQETVSALRADGYHVLPTVLPPASIDALLAFAEHAPAMVAPAGAGAPGPAPVDLDNPKADGFNITQQAILDNPAVQELLCDPFLHEMATAYMECAPILGAVTLRWSLPTAGAPSDDLAQLFHWDDDWTRWLKVFFYLTDVDDGGGPHRFVRGSHLPGVKPRHLLQRGYARIPDADVEPLYPREDIVTLTGPRGTVFVGDTRCWHKGLPPTRQRRLMLQIIFANSPVMGPTQERLVLRRSHTAQFRRFVRDNGGLFPDAFYVREPGLFDDLAQTAAVVPAGPTGGNALEKDPFAGLAAEHHQGIVSFLSAHPSVLLQVDGIRAFLSEVRYQRSVQANGLVSLPGDPGDAAKETIAYNVKTLATAAGMDRPSMLVRAVTSIERISQRLPDLKVLSVGPRSEIEVFALLAQGFQPQNISALDLYSYSPWVTIGDMHDMPFPDSSFDVAIHGWVLVYSRNPRKACAELVRCCRDRAIVAIANGYGVPEDLKRYENEVHARNEVFIQNCGQMLDYFPAGSVGTIYTRQEAMEPEGVIPHRGAEMGSSIVVFEVRK